ncbi:MAG: hypothetical protein K2J81_06990 [Treponemataceae bacterium]|nr:hypothetical protein [Treponemataceae bacterium]
MKKSLFVARFRIGEGTNFCLLLAFALGRQKIFVCSPLLRLGGQRHFAVQGKCGVARGALEVDAGGAGF